MLGVFSNPNNLAKITHVEPLQRFVDEQRVGPYAIWHHQYFFTALQDGSTEICDLVHYVLPGFFFGDFVRPMLVALQLSKIFAFREKAVRERFGSVRTF